MSADLIKQLLRAYANKDSQIFRKSALQIAAKEGEIGHSRLAEELREIIAKFPEVIPGEALQNTISMAQPGGELSKLIEGGYRDERLNSVVLSGDLEKQLRKIIRENHERSKLLQHGLSPTRRLLFYGPPGCGKTLSAKALAGELNMPLLTIRFDSLFSRFLGSTSSHLRTIFNEMPRRPGVYFFDEFDALGRNRGEPSDVGEIKRVVSSFLQLLDSDKSPSLIIAATNFESSIDSAIVRRFDSVLSFPLPTEKQILSLLKIRLGNFKIQTNCFPKLVNELSGFSFSDISKICDDFIRSMVLDGKKNLVASYLKEALKSFKNRSSIFQSNKSNSPKGKATSRWATNRNMKTFTLPLPTDES